MTPNLSVVVLHFNDSATLERCVARILAIASPALPLEITMVDDAPFALVDDGMSPIPRGAVGHRARSRVEFRTARPNRIRQAAAGAW